MTCAEATPIPKGSLLKLTDPFTAIIHSGDEDAFAGIAAEEKIAGDEKTKIAVYRGGIFSIASSAAGITAGNSVALSATANKVKAADATCVGGKMVGIAMESTAGSETIVVDVSPGANNNAY